MQRGLFIIALVAMLVLAGAFLLKPAAHEGMIIPFRRAAASVELTTGVVLSQRLIVPAGTYSGVALYSNAAQLHGQPVRVVIRDAAGDELAQADYARVTYVPLDEELLRMEMRTPFWTVADGAPVTVEVRLTRGTLTLQAANPPGDLYKNGALLINDEETPFDLALSLLTPQPLSSGARLGVIAGVATLLLLGLLYRFAHGATRWKLAAALVVVLAPLALGGYWFSSEPLGIADWDYYFSLHHSLRHSLVDLKTFPFWNPYTCGGTAGLGDPEFSMFTPTFLLELMFGVPAGLRLSIYLSVIVGAWGILALGRRMRLSVAAAFLAALAVAFSSVNLLEVTEGHVNVFAAMWIPWIFWSWLGAYRTSTKHDAPSSKRFGFSNRWTLGCGVFLALTFLQGGIYLLMYTGLAFATLCLLARRQRKALIVSVVSALWGMGLAAVKLAPVLAWLLQFPDQSYQGSAFTLTYLSDIVLGRHLHGAYVIPDQISGWHEYGAYIGPFVLTLALIGAARLWRQRIPRALIVSALLAIGLSTLGPHIEPVFDHLWFFPRSNISRIILFGVIPLALLAGMGLDQLTFLWPSPKRFGVPGSVAALLLVGLVAVDILSLSYPLSEQAFTLPEVYPPVAPAPSPIAYTPARFDLAGEGSRTTRAYAAARAGYGTFAYCSVLGPEAHVRTIYDEGGSRLLSAPSVELSYEVLAWSPNRVRARVTLPEESEITLNTNYARGWKAQGQPAFEVSGLVATRLPAGTHEVTFSYRSPGFYAGLAVSLATVALAVIGPSIGRRVPPSRSKIDSYRDRRYSKNVIA